MKRIFFGNPADKMTLGFWRKLTTFLVSKSDIQLELWGKGIVIPVNNNLSKRLHFERNTVLGMITNSSPHTLTARVGEGAGRALFFCEKEIVNILFMYNELIA